MKKLLLLALAITLISCGKQEDPIQDLEPICGAKSNTECIPYAMLVAEVNFNVSKPKNFQIKVNDQTIFESCQANRYDPQVVFFSTQGTKMTTYYRKFKNADSVDFKVIDRGDNCNVYYDRVVYDDYRFAAPDTSGATIKYYMYVNE